MLFKKFRRKARIRPFSRDFRDFRDSRVSFSEKTPFLNDLFYRSCSEGVMSHHDVSLNRWLSFSPQEWGWSHHHFKQPDPIYYGGLASKLVNEAGSADLHESLCALPC